MIFETLGFFLAAAPLANDPLVRRPELASENVIANGEPAYASFVCFRGAVAFQLRWPVPFEGASVDVGVGSGGEMDAAMGPSRIWHILAQAEPRVVAAPIPAAEIARAAGDDAYLLLLVDASRAPGTAQFKAAAVKVLFDDAAAQCPLAD